MIELTPEILLQAYAKGLFPMAEDRNDPRIFWVDPDMRGIIPLETFHVPAPPAPQSSPGPVRGAHRFGLRHRHRGLWPRRRRGAGPPGSTTRSSLLIRASTPWDPRPQRRMLARGPPARRASTACPLGGAFFGESMFSFETDASKVALVHLVARLKYGGYRMLDTQFVTKHLSGFGATEVRRADYRRRLTEALGTAGDFGAMPQDWSGEIILQSITQMS